MNIKQLKAGDEFVARRIDQNGRYEFHKYKIQKIAASNAIVGHAFSFNRETGKENGWSTVGPHLSGWEAFPIGTEEVTVQMTLKEKGQLSPAWSPEVVKLWRAVQRIRHAPLHEIEHKPELAAAIIAAYGKPDDWVPEVKQKI